LLLIVIILNNTLFIYLYLFMQDYTGSQCTGIGPLKKLEDDAILEPRQNTS